MTFNIFKARHKIIVINVRNSVVLCLGIKRAVAKNQLNIKKK